VPASGDLSEVLVEGVVEYRLKEVSLLVLGRLGGSPNDQFRVGGYQIRWLGLVRSYAPYVVEALVYALLAVVAFSLILFDRSDRVYLWMGAVFLLQSTHYALGAFDTWTQHLSILTNRLLRDDLLLPLINAGWVMVWWVWFGRQRPVWLPRAAAAMALLYMISNAIGEELFFALVQHPVAVAFHMVSLVVRLLFFALLVWIPFAAEVGNYPPSFAHLDLLYI
jgi:hypothetical protein